MLGVCYQCQNEQQGIDIYIFVDVLFWVPPSNFRVGLGTIFGVSEGHCHAGRKDKGGVAENLSVHVQSILRQYEVGPIGFNGSCRPST